MIVVTLHFFSDLFALGTTQALIADLKALFPPHVLRARCRGHNPAGWYIAKQMYIIKKAFSPASS